MSSKFQIYPRGFVGARLPTRIAKADESSITVAAAQNTFMISKVEDTVILGHPEVDRIWQRYCSAQSGQIDFEFREQALRLALKVFGTLSFSDWVSAQRASPSFGDMHEDFVDDIMHYIRTGRHHTDLMVWELLLNYQDRDIRPNKTVTDEYRKLHEPYSVGDQVLDRGDQPRRPPPEMLNLNLSNAIAAWHAHRGGFDDMMRTMHILYGTAA